MIGSAYDLKHAFFDVMEKEIRRLEANCGQGIDEQKTYWKRVGEIAAYKQAKKLLDEIHKGDSGETDDEEK